MTMKESFLDAVDDPRFITIRYPLLMGEVQIMVLVSQGVIRLD